MRKEIRLPAPHPRFRPRIEKDGRRPGHPGTAVRIGEELFEVVSAERAGGEWVYGLEPWTGQDTIRVLVDWSEEAEREFTSALGHDRVLERKRLLAWGGQALLGFLPAKHQGRLYETIGLDPPRATFWSAVLETAAGSPFAVLFVISTVSGGAGGFGNVPAWAGILALGAMAEGLFRLAAVISTGEPVGSLPFTLLDLRLKSKDSKYVPADQILPIGDTLNVISPVPKAWWERAGGVTYEGESHVLTDSGQEGTKFTYRFQKGGEGFPVLDPELEKVRNRSSDRSYVFAPLWGFLPADLQKALEFYGRYRPRPYVMVSIVFNFMIALAFLGPGLKSISRGVFEIGSLALFAAALVLLLESVVRLFRLIRNGEITGSLVGFLIRPLHDMAIKDHPVVPAREQKSPFVFRFLLVGLLGFVAPAAALPKNPMNVLLITVDTLRPDRLSCYGSRFLETPSVDALARRGVLFKRAFAHNTVTLPSHANILLGLTPAAHGVHDNSNFVVPGEFLTLAEFLKRSGYATGAFVGAFPLDSRFGLTQGFDTYDDNYGVQEPAAEVFVERPAESVIDRAWEWLESQPGPWFVWVHLFDPHQPYRPPEPFLSRFKDDRYSGEVAYVDQALGRLFSKLRAKGLETKTLTILTGDHGESLGEHGEPTHGYFAYNATLWVPLIISFPGISPVEISANVCHVDIFPTVCAVLGLERPAALQGLSLLPLMRGGSLPEREIYFEALTAYCNRGWAPLRGYIAGPGKFMESPIPELYDLGTDFSELKNLAPESDLRSYRKRFLELFAGLGSDGRGSARRNPDMETREKLRSLGYLASPQVQSTTAFSEKDDLKTLLPYHTKWMRATAARQAGRVDEGIALLRDIVAERPDFDLAHTYLSNYLKEVGKKDEALAVLRLALERNPSSIRIISSYGVSLIEAGRFDEAVAVLEHGLSLVDTDPEVWNYLGVAHWNKKRFGEAQRCYERALALDHNYAIVYNNLGSLFLSDYLAAKNPGLLNKAEAEFREAIRLDPRYASAYNGLGTALKMRGDAGGAVAAWEKALELKPDFDFPLYNLGLVQIARGNKSKALAYFLRYKEKYYGSLSAGEQAKLDGLIAECRE